MYAAAYFFTSESYFYMVLCLLTAATFIWLPYRYQRKQQTELDEFVEAVRYRDFTRSYPTTKKTYETRKRHAAFNELNAAFRTISVERETSSHHLQRILELVSTGILAYDANDGSVTWMNEAFRQTFNIPLVKNIEWLKDRVPDMYAELIDMKIGEGKVINVVVGMSSIKALVSYSSFQTEDKVYKLFAFQNVSDTLNETESTAWRRLLSVMTHEIMNSVTPISSLAGTLNSTLERIKDIPPAEQLEHFDDIQLGIDTIKRRSDGLLGFAQSYRSLNRTIELNLTQTTVDDLFDNIYRLMYPGLQQKGIELKTKVKDSLPPVTIDRELMAQVLINLITNAADAVREKHDAKIVLNADVTPNGKISMAVIDNGSGIEPEVLDKIFIPFFTTKKKGSGIGLSLCRQIVQQHKGSIEVHSEANVGTAFNITL